MKKILILLFLIVTFFCANAQAPQNQVKTRQLTVVSNIDSPVLKTTLAGRVNIYSGVAITDSSIQAATTQFVKRQNYLKGSFNRFAIPFGSSTGNLTQDSAAFNLTNGSLSLNSGSFNSIFLNNLRTEMQGNFNGFIFNVGSGYPGGGNYDQSKSYQFMNRGNVYLSMATAGAVSTSTFNTNLVVNGSLKITGGVPGAGKVLTSDAVGLASWQVPSGGGGGSTDTSRLSDRIDLKAAIASPTFTGFPAAPTQATGTSNTTLATTQFVQNSLAPQIQPAGTIFGNASITDAIPTFTTTPYIAGSLKIGTSAATDPSALLDLNSINKGLLLPRMTNSNINAIASPATGLLAYNLTDSSNYTFDGIRWNRQINANGLQTITGTTQTGSSANGILDLRQTYNTTGLVTAIKLTVTDVASQANSLLMDLRNSNGSVFSVGKNSGVITSPSSTYTGGFFSSTAGGSNGGTVNIFQSGTGVISSPAADWNILHINRPITLTSGNTTYTAVNFTPTINTTGTYTGIIRGLYFNPILTSVIGADIRAIDVTQGKLFFSATNTATGTTGAQTINKISGKVNFVAGATSLVVTNNLVTSSSIIIPVVESATPITISYVPAAGSFTLYIPTQATETKISFMVIN